MTVVYNLGVLAQSALRVSLDMGVLEHVSSKIRQEKLLGFIKILNDNISSCIIFVENCFKYFQLYITHKNN